MPVQASQKARKASSAGRAARQPAAELPVARVAVDISLPHLDRPFDYLVPDTLSARPCLAAGYGSGSPGSWLAASCWSGWRAAIIRASSATSSALAPEPALTPEIAGLARAVADRYGGTLADVLRLAIPPRHAGTSQARRSLARQARLAQVRLAPAGRVRRQPAAAGQPMARLAAWRWRSRGWGWRGWGWRGCRRCRTLDAVPRRAVFLAALAAGRSPRAVWSALPGLSWPDEIACAVGAVAKSSRGALLSSRTRVTWRGRCCPGQAAGPDKHVVLSASLGPAERYRRWLAVVRADVTIVAGTRSAMFAPVADLGLVVLWDEGDDLHAEPRRRIRMPGRCWRCGRTGPHCGANRRLRQDGRGRPADQLRLGAAAGGSAAMSRGAPGGAAAGAEAELARMRPPGRRGCPVSRYERHERRLPQARRSSRYPDADTCRPLRASAAIPRRAAAAAAG